MANSVRQTLTNEDWVKLSDGNKTVKLQVLTSDVLVYLTDSSDDPDDTNEKDSYVYEPTDSYNEISTALKIWVKKSRLDNLRCDIIYLTE